jgi:hypothetical protein
MGCGWILNKHTHTQTMLCLQPWCSEMDGLAHKGSTCLPEITSSGLPYSPPSMHCEPCNPRHHHTHTLLQTDRSDATFPRHMSLALFLHKCVSGKPSVYKSSDLPGGISHWIILCSHSMLLPWEYTESTCSAPTSGHLKAAMHHQPSSLWKREERPRCFTGDLLGKAKH